MQAGVCRLSAGGQAYRGANDMAFLHTVWIWGGNSFFNHGVSVKALGGILMPAAGFVSRVLDGRDDNFWLNQSLFLQPILSSCSPKATLSPV